MEKIKLKNGTTIEFSKKDGETFEFEGSQKAILWFIHPIYGLCRVVGNEHIPPIAVSSLLVNFWVKVVFIIKSLFRNPWK